METVFTIITAAGETVTTIVVSADDIAEARAEESYSASWTDADVAVDLYEQRYETALARAGYTYEQAAALGFTLAAR